MSNIYIQEPPTNGKVLLKTTVGDIDLELWSKETPKACRNFVQLCLEGYYNGTIFHRIVKGFIVQGGDPTGSGTGGESIYGHAFKDEIHSRLRFARRGLVAMANAGKDDNGSQFFFTMAATPELQNKHTIFAKVTGETIYNMIKLEECLVDSDDRPIYPPKILKADILHNPFPDIIPRVVPKTETKNEEIKKKKSAGVKNYKLLSFGEEAEEEDEEAAVAAQQYSGRSKSTHDLLSDPKLSSTPAVDIEGQSSSEDEESTDSSKAKERIDRIKNKLSNSKASEKKNDPKSMIQEDDEGNEEYEFGKEIREEKKRKAEELRQEFQNLKKDLHVKNKKKREEEIIKSKEEIKAKEEKEENDKYKEDYKKELESYKTKMQVIPKKGVSREDHTLALLAKFKNKLTSAKGKEPETEEEKDKEVEGDAWMAHKLHFEDKLPVLAKDASTKDDDWFEITDPRNAINKRRREASKQLLQQIEKRIKN